MHTLVLDSVAGGIVGVLYLTQQRDEAIEAERNAAVRRRSVLQRLEQVRKLGDCAMRWGRRTIGGNGRGRMCVFRGRGGSYMRGQKARQSDCE